MAQPEFWDFRMNQHVSQRRPPLLVGGILLLIGLLVVLLVLRYASVSRLAANPSPAAEVATLEAHLARIDERLDDLDRRVKQSGGSMPEYGPREGARRSQMAMALRESESSDDAAAIDYERDRLLRAHAADFQSEPFDPSWAPSVELDLTRSMLSEELISNVDEAPASYEIECRSSTCDISFDFLDPASAENWAAVFATLTGTRFANVWYTSVINADGSVRIQMYGKRGGET